MIYHRLIIFVTEKKRHCCCQKSEEECIPFFVFLLNITTSACLLESGLKLIFLWEGHLLTPTTSLFNYFVVVFALWTTENNEMSSGNNFAFDDRPQARPLI